MINNRNTYKKGLPAQAGFTLIETLIAVFVLMMAITGPLTLAERGLRATVVARDQDTAFYLAQDAMEFVRWVRDTNKLKGYSWLAGLDGTNPSTPFVTIDGVNGDCVSTTGAQKCYVNSLNSGTAITSCGASGAACSTALNYNSANNFFTYTATNGTTITKSIFTRSVSIQTPVGTNDCTTGRGCEALVTISVSWSSQPGVTRTITVRESLYDWQ